METIKPKKSFKNIIKYFGLCCFGLAIFVVVVFSMKLGPANFLGSLLNGLNINTPTTSNHYAYGENIGWIDFNPTGVDLKVGDNGLTGYAYGENVGWIKLGNDNGPDYSNTSADNWGVKNDGNGNLSGYAYGENIGWINFDPQYNSTDYGVKINTSTGVFSGYAYGENIGWINFNAGSGYGVVTDWRPQAIVNGTCGSSNSRTLNSIPTGGLCSSGTATAVSGGDTGPWTWSCSGANGGTDSLTCTATKRDDPGSSQEYTVTFNSQGGSSVSSTTTNYGGTITMPTAPTKNGYTFAGWNASSDGSGSAFDSSTPVVADITVYAKWTQNLQYGGGGIIIPNTQLSSQTKADILKFVSQNLTNLNSYIRSNPSFTNPAMSPSSSMHPVNPPSSKVPVNLQNNQNSVMEILNNILKTLTNLLNMVSV